MSMFHVFFNIMIVKELSITNITFPLLDLRVHPFHMGDKVRSVAEGLQTFSAHQIPHFPVDSFDMFIKTCHSTCSIWAVWAFQFLALQMHTPQV